MKTHTRLPTLNILYVAAFAIVLAGSAFASRYAAKRAGEVFISSSGKIAGAAAKDATWSPLREGLVLGYAESKGAVTYIASIPLYTARAYAAVTVNADGEAVSGTLIKPAAGNAYSKRLGYVIGLIGKRAERGGSPLDGSVAPLVDTMLEEIASLERERVGGLNGRD